jgi:hypothetical protein
MSQLNHKFDSNDDINNKNKPNFMAHNEKEIISLENIELIKKSNQVIIQDEPILIRRYIIDGPRNLNNYTLSLFTSLGSISFLLTGILSFFNSQLTLTDNSTNSVIPFLPQGLLMSFYGGLGFLISLFWWFVAFWNVGSGFNEFNKKNGCIRVFRWGFPGINRKVDLIYALKEVEGIKVELKQGINPQRTIYLKLKGNREIPLTNAGRPLTLKDIEKQASDLANFLQVSLEGL